MVEKPAWPKALLEEDLEAANSFFTETFGLPVVFEDGAPCVFKIGASLGEGIAATGWGSTMWTR